MRRLSRPLHDPVARRAAPLPGRPAPVPARRPDRRPGWPAWPLAATLLLAACTVAPPAPPPPRGAPADTAPSPATQATAGTSTGDAASAAAAGTLLRQRARWVPARWDELPGWANDRSAELWPALRAGCARPAAGWAALCARASGFNPPDDGFARQFLERELQPYRVEALDGTVQGLATGYFEPLVAASRLARPGFQVALHRPPADLGQRKPYWTRQQLDSLPAARAALRGQEIAFVASPLDALVLQIQGSGRLRVSEPDGSQRTVRLAFAGHNDQPYRSVGRWLIEQGELKADAANWPAIRDWGQRASEARRNEMLWSNPRVVFFREEPLAEARDGGASAGIGGGSSNSGANDSDTGAAAAAVPGPRGAQGVPLSAGRSVAVDPQAVPYGTPLWLDTTEPLSATPLRRLVMAQDTGGAITGAVRIDLFFGTGAQAEQLAGRMKQPLRVWALWPRVAAP